MKNHMYPDNIRKIFMSSGLVFVFLFLISCKNPLGSSSSADDDFRPGLSDQTPPPDPLTDFTEVFNFNNTSTDYQISTSTLEYTATSLTHKALTIDDDNSSAKFGGAQSVTRMVWGSNNALELTATGLSTGNGVLESRIMSAPTAINWTQLIWKSRLPAGKNHPNNKQTETDFVQDNLNMSDNVLLMHFDENSWSGTAGEVIDSSGTGNNGTAQGTLTTTKTDAKMGSSGNFLTSGSHTILIPHSSTLDSSVKMSWEAWIYPTNVDGNPRPIISKRQGTAGNYAYSIFIFAGGKMFIDIAGSTGSNRIDTGHVLSTGNWYHIAVTFDGDLASNKLKYYVNGSLHSQYSLSVTSIPATTASAISCIGCMNGNANTFLGKIDEVAIYERILSATEIASRYKRGSRKILIQARACVMSDCSDGTYVGPNNSTTDSFGENLNTTLTGTTTVNLPSAFNNRQYFQYKATLISSNGIENPQLQSVEIKPTLYDYGYPTVVNNTGFAFQRLDSFVEDASGDGTIGYQVSPNGTNWYYWNNTSWVPATSGFAHTNSASAVSANMSSFSLQGTFYFRAFFDSGTNGMDSVTLRSITVEGGR